MATVAAWQTISLVVGAAATIKQGQASAEQYSQQAKAEESNAKNRQIQRKRNLIQALSMQNVRAGASGISGGAGSSQEAIAKEDIRLEEFDAMLDIGSTSQRINQLKSNASNASTYSLLSAGSEVASSAARTKKRGTTE